MTETRDTIRERMLTNLDSKYDKQTGTWTWETFQAEAIELENMQILLSDGLDQAFAGTADLEHLKVIAFENRGILYKDATKSSGVVKVTGVQGAVINIGDLFTNQLVQYQALEKITLDSSLVGYVKVECTTAGSVGNTPMNTIISFPVTLAGINTVTNEQAFANGYDEEGRESLLKRYYQQIQQPATSGNINHYIEWATSVNGVGDVKIKPTWNGGGTVKIVVLNSNREPADATLVNNVKTYVETQMPINVDLTIVPPTLKNVNISCSVSIKTGYTLDQVKANIQTAIEGYFKEISFKENTIYYAKIGSLIFNALGVNNLDYATFTINNGKVDIILLDTNQTTEVADLNTLTVTQI